MHTSCIICAAAALNPIFWQECHRRIRGKGEGRERKGGSGMGWQQRKDALPRALRISRPTDALRGVCAATCTPLESSRSLPPCLPAAAAFDLMHERVRVKQDS